MPTLAMFPLGSVLFPHMPLRLRVFEQRYLIMLHGLLRQQRAEFGVVLIERGQEVGGGEKRFRHGTVAEITALGPQQGFIGVVAEGRSRFEVEHWLPDDPHPRAQVRELPDLEWERRLQPGLARVEKLVRRALAMASEFAEHVWPTDIKISDDPGTALWQLAGIAPLGPMDQLELLRASSAGELLAGLERGCRAVAAAYSASWPEDEVR